jgi:hypothetical protein
VANVTNAIVSLGCITALALAAGRSAAGADETFFREKVAPILERRCVHCHGGPTPKGDLSLRTAAAARKGGATGPAVVPGKPEESVLLDMIAGDPPEMPQKDKPLSEKEVALIRSWIERGATWPAELTLNDRRFEDQTWWAFESLHRPELPQVNAPRWVRTPIDAFILATLEQQRLTPGPEADRRTLIRRLSFDLIGLPPTPEEIEAFIEDPNPNAYETLVDRLLASPHHGERWGRHWLDVVHYGDTHGYDKDKRRNNAWRYRDYVISELNSDVPYGRFIREQVAGDVLWPGDARGTIATGFIAAGPWDFVGHVELREGTVDKLKTRVLDRDDMVSSTMSTFVSLTVHCARCHDHKFDPITQTDYYRLQAVFAGVDRGDRPYQSGETHSQSVAKGALVYAVQSHSPRPITVLRRGDVEQPGESVGPGTLACFPGLPATFALPHPDDEGSRRAALANWLANPENMLTWRSIANRLWHYHFGRGIVETPNDFGRNGARPTHPALLDWLAVEMRDFELFFFKDDHSPTYDHTDPAKVDNPRVRRRTVYRFNVRSVPNPFMEALDCADPNLNTPVRSQTLTALQALALWNDLFMVRQSQAFARRLAAVTSEPRERVIAAYRLALGREPRADECDALAAYAAAHGLAHACRLLWNTNEFVFVD